MGQGTRQAIVVAALSVVAGGCATETWTRDLFAKRLAEVDERFVKVDTGARRQGQRIDGVDARIDRVEERIDRVDERLVEVDTEEREQGERIDRVEVRTARLDTRLTETRNQVRGIIAQAPSTGIRSSAPEPRTARTTPETATRRTLVSIVHVRFGFDRADLNVGAEAALATIAKELRDNPNLTIDLEGATDPVGTLDYNVRLSQRRVDVVRRWLVTNGVPRARIVGSIGRGPLLDASVKDDAKRRVMVKLMTSE